MSAGPDAVRVALDSAILGPNREIDLAVPAADPAFTELHAALEVLRHEDRFVLSGTRPAVLVDGTVTLSGYGFFGLPGAPEQHLAPVEATLTYSAPAGRDRFVLALKVLRDDWTFSTTFPVLPVTQTARPSGVTVRADSFLIGLPLAGPVFTATAETDADPRLVLSGSLLMNGVLQPYAARFGAGPLALSGTVVLPESPAEPPGLDLFAPATAQPDVVLGPVALRRFGLGIRTVTGLNPRAFGFSAYSALDASAELHLGFDAGPPAARATSPLLAAGPGQWRLIADFGPDSPTLAAGLAAVGRLLGLPGDVLTAAPGLPQITGFALTEAEAGIHTPDPAVLPELEYAAVTLVSELDWLPTIPFFALRRVGMRWVAYWDEEDGATPGSVAGSFFGDVEVTAAEVARRRKAGRRRRLRAAGIQEPDAADPGDPDTDTASAIALPAADELAFTFRLSTAYPGWAASGRMIEGDIPLGELLAYFLGAPSPLDSLKVTELGFEADLEEQRFAVAADIDAELPVPLAGEVTLVLTGLGLNVAAEAGTVTGGLLAGFGLARAAAPGEPEPRFHVGAEYTGAPDHGGEGWVFSGGLADGSTVDLVNLVAALTRSTVPDWAGRLSLVVLDARFATGTKAFHFAGALAGRWQPELFGLKRPVSAEARAEVSRAGADQPLTARLAGTFTVDRLTVGAAAVLDADEATYELSVAFGALTFAAVTGWRGEPGQPGRHQVISFQVGGATLGELIEHLVALAAPTADFRLEPPWDVLSRIELSRFTVTVDPTERTVELVYRADAALPLITVETVGLKLARTNGRSSVDLILTGDFLGRDYRAPRQLSWDLLSQNPPTVPGAGSQLLDLRYLALGQRIALADPPGTVRAVVDQLRRDMAPARPDANPLRGSPMHFSADAEWLIGLDATVAGLLDLALVFNDPRLYGLAVGLRGQKAGGLAGLAFEVLYKKVSDDVGVFRVELRLPEAFRRIELGAVSVTAGLVVVEVYTDGGFLVDLGFPHEGDFSRAFSVEAFPFLGRGGLYFGVLQSAGTDLVPAVSNGVFSPVLALGVGFAGGVGKEVRSGPLSGGAYVELSALFEGVFAWFTPTGAGAASAVYHWVQASVGVHGKVYGAVELAVLKASITIEAWASVTVVLEAFRATQVAVSARVEVNASLQIAFIQLSFSFQAEVDLGFTLGTDQPAPWILTAPGRPGRRALPPPRHRPEVQVRLLRAAHLRSLAARSAAPELKWDPSIPVFTDSPRWTDVSLLPLYSATDLPVGWGSAEGDEAGPDPAALGYRVAFCLFAEDGGTITPAGQPRPPASAELSTQTTDPRKLSAQTFIEALLRWSISAVAGSPGNDPNATVTAGQLRFLAEQLDAPETVEGPFGLTDLGRFFAANAPWRILAEPAITGPAEAAVREGTAIPLPPYLTWNSPQWGGERHFISHNGVGPVYLAGAAAYAAQFTPTAPAEAVPPPPDDPAAYQSFATRAFRDWCLMVAKTGVQAAVDAMTGWSEKLEADSSLAEAALRFPRVTVAYAVRAGDTLDSVADALGATADQLAFLDDGLAARLAAAKAGAVIDVVLGVTPEVVAADNAAFPLRTVVLELGTVDYPVAAGDSLAQVAARFGLPGPAALFTDPDRDLAGDGRLLRPGASAPVHAQRLAWTGSRIMAAAVFFTHFYAEHCAVEDVDGAAWYMQFLFDRNGDRIRGGAGEPITAGTMLDVPLEKYSSATEKYASVPGDTVGLLGAALALARDFATGSAGPVGWSVFRDAVVAVPGGQIDLPEARLTVLSGESLRRFAERSALYPDVAAAAAWLGAADVLTPTFLLPVPHARAGTASGENLAELAARVGLSLADLAHRIRHAVIYQASVEKPLTLTVAHLLVQSIDTLVGAVIDAAALGVAGNSARQLLSGQRLPDRIVAPDGRVTAGPETHPLYTLTGQMGVGPAPDAGPPEQVALQVDFGVEPGVPWIELSGSAVAQPDPAFPAVNRAVLPPEYEPFNPAVAHDPGRLRPGMILRTGAVDALGFRITYATLGQRYPGVGLTVKPLAGPAALPTAVAVPLAYDLPRRIALQAPKPAELAIPQEGAAPLTGQATVWPFPPKLLAKARSGDSSLRYDVAAFVRRDQRDSADLLFDTTFGTMFGFGVRRIEGRPGVYALLPADQSDRATALALSRYITTGGSSAADTVAYLLAAPTPDATDTAGRIVLDAAPTGTYVLRTNLSTQNEPPSAGALPGTAGLGYGYADLTDLAGFCLLLWAGSVTGGTGCLVGFATESGEELPPGLFDEQGTARLSLLAIPGDQQEPARLGRMLLPVNTCALAAPTLDPGLSALFLEAADDSEYTLEPALPPGTAGFRLHLADPGDGESQDATMQRLFSLMTAAIPGGGPDGRYVMPPTGLPAGPQVDDGSELELWQRERRARRLRAGRELAPVAAVARWRYAVALPVTRFGPASPLAALPGLPRPDLDPYRGLTGDALPLAGLRLGFADVLGNVTAASGGDGGLLPVPIGYTDPLLPVGAWPAATASYAVTGTAPGEIRLVLTLAPQPGAAGGPGAGAGPDESRAAALRLAERYAQAYYQLAAGRVTAALLSTLRQRPDGGEDPLPVDAAPLWRFAAAAHAAARAAAVLRPVTAGGRPAVLAATRGISLADLARVNALRPLAAVFGTLRPAVPGYTVAGTGDTADALRTGLRSGWPDPGSGTALLGLPANLALPLRPGTALATPSRSHRTPAPGPHQLAELAQTLHTTPGLLAQDNAATAGILQPGFYFVLDGVPVQVPEDPAFTFDQARIVFDGLGIGTTVATLATEAAERPGMIRGDAALVSKHYLAVAGETLAENGSTFTGAQLAALNAATADVFEDGALVFLGTFDPAVTKPEDDDTLAGYAGRFGCPPDLLLAANAQTELPANALVLPGTAAVPPPGDPERPVVPYTAASGETLAGISTLFAATALGVAEASRGLPGLLTAGQQITVRLGNDEARTITVAGDSFDAVLARLRQQVARIELADLVAVIGAVPGMLAADALLLCPTAVLPGTPGAGLSPRAAGQRYHLDPAALAEANLATTGLIAAGVSLADPAGGERVLTGAQDTLNSLTARFARGEAVVTVAQIITANADEPMFAVGASLLLPPAPVRLSASLGTALGAFAVPVFPLRTTLRLTRPAALIDPSFRTPDGAGTTQQADTVVPAPAASQGKAGEATLTLAAFAGAFHAAYPHLRLGTARAAAAAAASGAGAAAGADSGAATVAADLWVTDFRPGRGISEVALRGVVPYPGLAHPAPRCFALRPLYQGPVNRPRLPVRALLPDGRLAPTRTPVDFLGVDAEVLARRLLADVDRFLSPGCAPGVYADPAARDTLRRVLLAKVQLAGAVAAGLDAVLDLTDPDVRRGQVSAAAALSRELAVGLSRAYDAAAVVQYGLAVASPWTADPALPPARLTGPARPVLEPGQSEAVPYTLSSARLPLAEPESFVNFLMRVPDPARHRKIDLDVEYSVLDLQFGVTGVPGLPGFEDSAWLSFYPPLTETDRPAPLALRPGRADVPVPLRAYPDAPALLDHSALPTVSGRVPTLAETRLWNYTLTYAHEHAEQDEVLVTARFNLRARPAPAAPADGDVAAALLGYAYVADPLWGLLARYTGGGQADAAAAAHAAESFAELVEAVASQWDQHWVVGDADADPDSSRATAAPCENPPCKRYDFRVRVRYEPDTEGVMLLREVVLSGVGTAPVDPATWPTVACRRPDGTDQPLHPQPPTAASRVYRVPDDVRIPAGPPPTVTLGWNSLPISAYQNAAAELSVRRNQHLLGETGPATRDAFVFRTAATSSQGPVNPMLSWPEALDISSPGTTFGDALAAAFKLLADNTEGLTASVGVDFGRPQGTVLDAAGRLAVLVPVALGPKVALTEAGGRSVATQAEGWYERMIDASMPGRFWAVTVTVPSGLDPASRQPLLALARLIFREPD